MYIPGAYFRPNESESLRVGAFTSCFNKLSSDFRDFNFREILS